MATLPLPSGTLPSLAPYQVGSLPSLYIIPDFISDAIAQQLLTNIMATKQSWQQVCGRRLQNHGGIVSGKGALIPAPMPRWLQSIVSDVSRRIPGLYGDESANHVLINSYDPGDGIMPHQDGPLYYPSVAILSLGSPAVVRFTRKREETDVNAHKESFIRSSTGADNISGPDRGICNGVIASVVVPPCSLLVFKDEAYEKCLHGIDFVAVEDLDTSVVNPNDAPPGSNGQLVRSGTRVSLTIRRVLRVHSLGIKIR